MGQATVVSLKARPWQSAQLCFEVGGILETLAPDLMLGATVTAFPFPTFYGGPMPSPSSDPSLLAKSADIWTQLQPSYLASLRAEPRKAALDMAVNSRQNAYYAKYSPTAISNIVSAANCYAPTTTNNNLSMLQQLQTLSQTQTDQLATAYNNNSRGWPGYPASGVPQVVLNTTSQLKSTTYTTDSSTATPNLTTTTTPSLTTSTTPNLTTTTSGEGSETEISGQNVKGGVGVGTSWPGTPDPNAATDGATWTLSQSPDSEGLVSENASGETSSQTGSSRSVETGTSTDKETGSEASTGGAYAVESETINNYDYTYRVPFVEAQAQNLRAQISLNNQQFSLTVATQNVPQLSSALQNELSSIDLYVYQLQIGFSNTVLMPSINGTVTGIFKYPGDPVRAGEPVIRIDDNSQMLLVARLVYPGPINLWTPSPPPGSVVTINTTLYDESPLAPPLTGQVVAVRGAGDDDLWDVVILCTNPLSSGNLEIPVGYNFDYDNTTVTIT